MATYDGSIRINTAINTRGFDRGVSHLRDGVVSIGNSMSRIIKTFGFGLGIAGLVSLGKQAIDTASDIQEVQNVVDTAFGDMSYKMERFADTAVTQFGISKLSAKEMGSTFMAMGRSMISSMEEASDMAINLTARAADMSSFHNKSIEETSTALKSIYTGETESLKEYGVVMTQVNLQEFARQQGINKSIQAMTQAEKVQLQYAYVMKQTSLAAGDFAKTSDSWANQTRILSEQFKELLSVLGGGLVAVFTPIVKFLNTILSALITIARQISAILSSLFGISIPTAQTGKMSEDMEGAADGAYGFADGMKEAGKAADKAKGKLASFDKLEVLKKDSGKSVGGSAGAGGASGIGDIFGVDSFENTPTDKLVDMSGIADKMAAILRDLRDAAKDALEALSRLWNEGLALLGNFVWNTLQDFYEHFLVPVGKWILGEGLPRLFDITNKLLKSINWGTLQRRLRDFYDVLAKLAKFTFKALLDFYEHFLVPIAVWTMNRALPMLLQTLTDLGNKINWDLLNSALASIWQTLSKFAIGIGEGLILFWKGIEPLVTSAVAGIINGIALALQFFFDVLGMIPDGVLVALGGAIGGLLSVIVSYAAASLVMDSLSTAWTALYIAFDDGLKLLLAHPYVAIAAGIGAVVGALVSLQERAKERSEIEAYGKTIDDLTSQFQNNRNEIEGRAKAASEYVDNAGLAEISHAEKLKEKYFELAEKQNKSNEEYALMRSYASQLADIIPGLSEHINEETGLLDLQADSIQALIDKQQEYYRVQAAKEKIIELYQAQFDMEEEIKNQTDKVKIAQEELNKALEDEARINADYWENMGVKRGEESLALQEARQNVIDLNTELQNSISAYDEIGSSIDNMTQTIVAGETKLSEAGTSGGQAYKKGVADSINEQMGWGIEAKGVADKINQDMGWDSSGKDGAGGYAEGFKSGKSTIEEATRVAVEAGIAAAKEAQDSHSPSEVYKGIAKDAIDGYKLGIEENTGIAVSSMKSLFSAMQEVFTNPSSEESGVSGIFSGIYEQLNSFMETWTETFSAWQETNGETFFSYDYWYEQFSNILTAYTDMFAEFSAQWQADMDTWWATMVLPFFNLAQWTLFGTQMKNGILTGLKAIVNEIGGLLNKIIGMFNSAFKELEGAMNDLISDYNKSAKELGTSTLSKVKYSPMASIKVPALADGAVIRGGNPFLAILGDQRYGQTNIEAPIGTIKQAVREEMMDMGYVGSRSGNVPVTINLNYNGETFARLSIPDILSELNRQGYDITSLMGNG